MFTGIVEETGVIADIMKNPVSARLKIRASKVLEGTKPGDSIAVNGICLTVTELSPGKFSADVMHETLNRASPGGFVRGAKVNLERAMAAGERFGGHIVSGHVDGTGIITDIKNDGIAVWFTIRTTPSVMRYIVEKGSIAVDGMSLTVARTGTDDFAFSAIPHTIANTILSAKKKGDSVNLENDIIGKYVENLLNLNGMAGIASTYQSTYQSTYSRSKPDAAGMASEGEGAGSYAPSGTRGITKEFLSRHGF